MQYFTTDLDGVTMVDPPAGVRRQILASVQGEEEADYPEVFLTVPATIVLAYRRGGYLLWEDEGEVIRSMANVGLDRAEEAWNMALEGDLERLQALPWQEPA